MKESPIFTKTFDMLAWLLPATLKFPREHRFVLAQRTQNAAFDFYEAITAASLSQPGNTHFLLSRITTYSLPITSLTNLTNCSNPFSTKPVLMNSFVVCAPPPVVIPSTSAG